MWVFLMRDVGLSGQRAPLDPMCGLTRLLGKVLAVCVLSLTR